MHTRFRYEYLVGRYCLEYLGLNRIIILKRILKVRVPEIKTLLGILRHKSDYNIKKDLK
jgi:hypothetical protein